MAEVLWQVVKGDDGRAHAFDMDGRELPGSLS